MENYKLVLPEHLNHYGYLFGGNLLKWVDESAYIAARAEYPRFEFVTVAMNRVEFKKRVHLGAILRFHVERTRIGRTSVDYEVRVFVQQPSAETGHAIFSTTVTFVCIDQTGQKQTLTEPVSSNAKT